MRPAGRGFGILAQGAFLATHASSDSSSPTKRGLFPFYRLFCQPTRTPPPNVPQIGQPMPGVMTTRQRYEIAHAPAGSSCGRCHSLWDPIGFGFEHYDEGGRFRDTESGLPINSAASVPDPDQSRPTSLFSFTGEEDLVTGLADLPVVNQCVAAYLATFAFGTRRGVHRVEPGGESAGGHRRAWPRRSCSSPTSRTSRAAIRTEADGDAAG